MVDEIHILTEPEAMQFLGPYGIPFSLFSVAHSPAEAMELASTWSEPFVLKVVSRDIQHKSDAGGVRLGVTQNNIAAVYDDILETVSKQAPGSVIDGILIQPQASSGIEVIVGVQQDEAFGHAVLLGVGGVLSELIDGVSIRLLPIDVKGVKEMLTETKLGKLLKGARNFPPGDVSTLCQLVTKLSLIVKENPGIIELDLNPVIVHPQGVTVVDVLVVCDHSLTLSKGRHRL